MSDLVMAYLEAHEDCQCEPSEFECHYHTALSDYQQLKADKQKAETERDRYKDAYIDAEAQIMGLREAIQKVLADEESGEGWGPDVTVCAYLRKALEGEDDA